MFELLSIAQINSLAWYEQPWAVLLFVVAAVIVSYFLAQALSRATRTQEQHGWRLWLIFSALSISAIVVGLKWPPKFGVDLRGGITIIGQLKQDETGQTIDIATQIPRMIQRVDPSGTQEILIRPLGTDKIEVTIPDVTIDEAQRIWKRLTQAGHLKFRILADERFHPRLIARARELIESGINDAVVREKVVGNVNDNLSGGIIGRWYQLGREEEEVGGIRPFRYSPSNTNVVRNGTTKQLLDPSIFTMDPVNLARWAQDNNARQIEILAVEPASDEDRLNVEGKHIATARPTLDDRGGPAVLFDMTKDGRGRMGYLTSRHPRRNEQAYQLAIISDEKLLSAPEINSTITSTGIIEGRFTNEEVEDLVINLQSGRLEVALNEQPISQDYVESTIGEDLRRKGLVALALSFALIVVFMVVYYRFAGALACAELFANLLMTIAFVILIKQPLTMTGLAGLVLTVGMSVDANVLIYERIREELAKGSALRMAIRNGFDRAMSAIVDGNITMLFTAMFLYLFGSEQLKGFAVTLSVGICTSMFTAVFCSRVFFEMAERKRWITDLKMLKIFPGGVIDFVGRRRLFYTISLVVIVVGLAATFVRGKQILDNDLRGGSTARVVLGEGQRMSLDEFRAEVAKYDARIDNEQVEFSVSKINSEEFPDRVFKVDSNIPVWESDEREAPYKEIDEALQEIFGDRLMQVRVVVDKVNVDRLDAPTPPAESSSSRLSPVRSMADPRSKWAVGALALLDARFVTMLSAPVDAQDETAPQDPMQPSPSSDAADKNSTTQETPSPSQETPPPAQEEQPSAGNESPAAQETPPAAQETPPVTQDAPPGQPAPNLDEMLKQNQPGSARGVGRYRVTAEVAFDPPVPRRALIDSLIAAAEATEQVTLDPSDITVSAEGIDAEDPGTKSASWTVSLVVPRENDGRLVLERMQADADGQPYFQTISGVGGQIAARTQYQALGAILGSLLVVIAYIWFRFQSLEFGLAAVIALVHDVLVTLGAIALSYWLAPALGILQVENFRISLPVIAAFLTLIGYSLNDTIVIFDRVREIRGKRTELTAEMLNVALSQTLSRTILTAGTVLVVTIVLYFLGGESIHAFSFALLVGIIAGSYSSLFVAAPILLWLMNRRAGVAARSVPAGKAAV